MHVIPVHATNCTTTRTGTVVVLDLRDIFLAQALCSLLQTASMGDDDPAAQEFVGWSPADVFGSNEPSASLPNGALGGPTVDDGMRRIEDMDVTTSWVDSGTGQAAGADTPSKQRVIALYDYAATESDELSVVKGEVLDVLDDGSRPNWVRGAKLPWQRPAKRCSLQRHFPRTFLGKS